MTVFIVIQYSWTSPSSLIVVVVIIVIVIVIVIIIILLLLLLLIIIIIIILLLILTLILILILVNTVIVIVIVILILIIIIIVVVVGVVVANVSVIATDAGIIVTIMLCPFGIIQDNGRRNSIAFIIHLRWMERLDRSLEANLYCIGSISSSLLRVGSARQEEFHLSVETQAKG